MRKLLALLLILCSCTVDAATNNTFLRDDGLFHGVDTLPGIGGAGTYCLQISPSGAVSNTGAACGSGGAGIVNSVANSDGTLTISPTTGAVVASLALGHANTWSARQNLTDITTANEAAPATPSAGLVAIYSDSTQKILTAKNDAGVVSNTVVASTAATHNFATGVSAAGVISYAQPAAADVSGLGTFATQNFATPPAIGGTTPAAGSFTTLSATGLITVTNIAAPSTPSSGKTGIYVDSTQKVLTAKNDAGTVSNTVVPSTAPANQFANAISSAGVISYGTPTNAQVPVNAVTNCSVVAGALSGPGMTTNTTNMNNCLANNVAVMLPPGIYNFNGCLTMGQVGASLVGVGQGATGNSISGVNSPVIITINSTSVCAITMNANGQYLAHLYINRVGIPVGVAFGVKTTADIAYIYDVTVYGHLIGFALNGAVSSSVCNNCNAWNNYSDGFNITGSSPQWNLINTMSGMNDGRGYLVNGTGGGFTNMLQWTNPFAFANAQEGIMLAVDGNGAGTTLLANAVLIGAGVSGSGGDAIFINTRTGDAHIRGCFIENPGTQPTGRQTATFTGSISGNTLTVSGVTGTIAIGNGLNFGGAPDPNTVSITGGSGLSWTISGSPLTISSEGMYTTSTPGSANANGIHITVNNSFVQISDCAEGDAALSGVKIDGGFSGPATVLIENSYFASNGTSNPSGSFGGIRADSTSTNFLTVVNVTSGNYTGTPQERGLVASAQTDATVTASNFLNNRVGGCIFGGTNRVSVNRGTSC